MSWKKAIVTLGIGFIVTGSALTAQTKPEDNVVFEKHTKLTFDGSEIKGGRETPSGGIITSRRQTAFGKMIGIRKDFRMELLSSTSQL